MQKIAVNKTLLRGLNMELRQSIFEAFEKTGNIGFYLLYRELEEEDVQEHTRDSVAHK